jgi:hypothetical protein
VARDASGNFSAGTITAALSGNATTSTAATNLSGGAANRIAFQTGSGATGFVPAPTASGQNVTWNGSSIDWAAGPAAGISYVLASSNYTAANREGVLTNTSGGSFTVTLPVSPATGAQVIVADAANSWGVNNLTVGRNGSTIGGLAENLVCDINGVSVQFVYDGSTWEVYAQIGGNGGSEATIFAQKLVLTSQTLSTASAGTLEYDGRVPYFTPQGLQRGVVPGMQYYRLNSALVGANATGAQSVLGVGVTLSANTVYAFEAVYLAVKSAGTTAHSVGFGFGGTVTLNNISYLEFGNNSAGAGAVVSTSSTLSNGWVNSASNTTLIPSTSTAAVNWFVNIRGTVSINAGGTFIPQYSLSAAPGGAYTTQIGSYFFIYPISASGSNTSVGTWA